MGVVYIREGLSNCLCFVVRCGALSYLFYLSRHFRMLVSEIYTSETSSHGSPTGAFGDDAFLCFFKLSCLFLKLLTYPVISECLCRKSTHPRLPVMDPRQEHSGMTSIFCFFKLARTFLRLSVIPSFPNVCVGNPYFRDCLSWIPDRSVRG